MKSLPEIHQNIKVLRIKSKLSREEVAEKLSLSVNAYGRLERGEVELSVSRIKQLSEIFDVTEEELTGVSSNKNSGELLEEIKKLNKKIEDLQSIVRWVFQNAVKKSPLEITIHHEYMEKIKEMGLDVNRYSDTTFLTKEQKKTVSDYLLSRPMKINGISTLINSNIFALEEWEEQVKAYIYVDNRPSHIL